jgi:hypothetical protein
MPHDDWLRSVSGVAGTAGHRSHAVVPSRANRASHGPRGSGGVALDGVPVVRLADARSRDAAATAMRA